MIKGEEIKKLERESYDVIAETFHKVWARYTGRFAGDLIDLMFPQLGEKALDLAGGSGAAAIKLAERVGPNGQVTIIDISPGMLKVAEKNAADRNLTNIVTRAMDAENLEFHDATFDLITCSFGVMFFPQIERAVAEAYRVLKPGGRIGFVVWGDPDHTPFITVPAKAVIRRIAPSLTRWLLNLPWLGNKLLRRILITRGTFGVSAARFCSPGSLEKHLSRAGFQSPRREPRAYPLEFSNFDDFWHGVTHGTVGGLTRIQTLAPALRDEVMEEVRSRLVGTDGGIYVHNEAALILAQKPA